MASRPPAWRATYHLPRNSVTIRRLPLLTPFRPLHRTTTSKPAHKSPGQKIEIRYTDPKAVTHLLRTNPDYRAAFLSVVASIPELNRAYKDLEEYLRAKGYADAKDPLKMPDSETRARMQTDQVLVEKSLLVQKLLKIHGVVRTVAEAENSAKPGRSVQLVDGVVPSSKLGMEPLQTDELSPPLRWFKSLFMTGAKEGSRSN
ncbi:uncharacterized protein SPPG_08346 [Spizellomyces punctatus DAOM BR117]|uniref:Uncharacterized protein n=1 Tax=Spizellomyces punctatus (strain DAOM BR117) TaxID=645134 RepID=A0A0L0H4R4_SPIPD|nr:uncharacterized protein SPPG_08346 [Spizellomyces punctatus DAOM BR117]KNC96192.1 hypothetical protein SPPG_08346 [Spizellomyces punctatus DAOM BR117]|eukprot:XP_016604232.1 hypothetical protein SPPG_08346 [Spizellomyces punctatus DAOM BR117]